MEKIKRQSDEKKAIEAAAKMLRRKTFSETYSYVENFFSVKTSKVMKTAIEKYRFSFV